MISDKKRIIRQLCAFLLAFAMVWDFSSAAVVDAADFLEGTLLETTAETTSQTDSGDTGSEGTEAQETTKETTQETITETEKEPAQAMAETTAPAAVQSGAAYLVSRAADESSGIDIYAMNGSYLTLLGKGLYSIAGGESLPLGTLDYHLKASGEFTRLTEIKIAADITLTATLHTLDSTYLTLDVADHSNVTLIISGACGLGSIVLGEGASLNILVDTTDSVDDGLMIGSVSGGKDSSFTVTGLDISLMGDLVADTITLSTSALIGTVDSDIKATGNLTLNNMNIHAGEGAVGEISAMGDLTVEGNTTDIKATSLGISEGGEGSISLIGGVGKIAVENLGALSEGAKAYPSKLEMKISGDAVELWDYTITYQNYGELGYEDMTPGDEDAVIYRVKKAAGNTMIVGYHMQKGTYVAAANIPLTAVAERADFEFRVWSSAKMADDADFADDKTNEEWLVYDGKEWDAENSVIKDAAAPVYGYAEATITSNVGNVVLYAIYVPESVIVRLHTNTGDASERIFAAFPAYVGAKGISLQVYLESDALKVQGQSAEMFSDAPEGGNIVNSASFRVTESGDGSVDLYAVWSAALIQVTYRSPDFYSGYTYQYIDSNGVWQTIPAATHEALNEKLTELLGTLDIHFGQKYGELPLLRCLRAGDQDGAEYNFVGWYIESANGERIMLDAETVVSASTTAPDALEIGSQVIFALFENARYTLTVPTSLGKWQFLDGSGNEIQFTDNNNNTMSAYVNSDTVITMKRADETTVAAYWRLTNQTTGAYIWPEEMPSANGGSYWLSYTFTMPKASVNAVYDETVRWDTAMGDYVFDTYDFNGYESYGFQILDRETGSVLHTFRWIMENEATTVYFTSSKDTDHQIKLDATTNLYLDGVQLSARGEIVDKLSAFYTSGVYSGSMIMPDAANYHNLYFDNNPAVIQDYKSTTMTEIRITLLNDSKIFSIGQKAWINHHMSGKDPKYWTTVKVNGGGHAFDFYSYLIHGFTTLNNCVINVLRSGDDDADEKIHWYHTDSNTDVISGCTIDANGRSFFSRFNGSMSNYGNAVTIKITDTTLTNLDTSYTSWLSLKNVNIAADRILSYGYGFNFTDSTVRANIIGYQNSIHTTYTNSTSTFSNCDIVVADWMSLSRPRITGGTTLTVTNGLYLYESLGIYGNSVVTVGSLGRFKTLANSTQDGKHYSGTDANHYFYVNIYGGADLTVKGDVNIGVNHSSMPEIKVYGAGTTVSIEGNADIINTVRVYDGAAMTVAGDLTLHQDLEVKGENTVFIVNGNLYHVTTGTGDSAYKTVSYDDGTSEKRYFGFSFADESTVTLGGDIGSKGATDRTHVAYTRGSPNLTLAEGKKVIRDVQVVYTMPDGFTNSLGNPDNIRLENDVYVGSTVTLLKPENTGGSSIELEDDCWFSGDVNWTGWTQNETLLLYDGVLRLTARATNYLLNILRDMDVFITLQHSVDGGQTWLTDVLSDSLKIPIDAMVRVTVPSSYDKLVCAESLIGGVYTPVILTKESSGENTVVTFRMDAMQIMLTVAKNLTLYLDESHIHVQEKDGELGFARYNGTVFVPYGGNLIVSQKNTSVSCLNTLYIERNVADNAATLTMTGIEIKSGDETVVSDTVYFTPGVEAALYLLGTNHIRNIRVPKNAIAILLGDDNSSTWLMSSPYFSGTVSQTDTARYYSMIGDCHSGAISMIGGTYTSDTYHNHQGSNAAGIGGAGSFTSSGPMVLRDVTLKTDASFNSSMLSFPGGTIQATNLNAEITGINAGVLFRCRDLKLDGEGTIAFNNVSDNAVSVFSSVSTSIEIRDKVIVHDNRGSNDNLLFLCNPNLCLTLSDDAAYVCHGNVLLSSLTVEDNATLRIYDTTGLARGIAAKTIHISGGEVTCGFLLASGYVTDAVVGNGLIEAHDSNEKIAANGTLVISGGSVTAEGGQTNVVTRTDVAGTKNLLSGIIGGSRGAQITIIGGVVKASVIGESEYLFGFYRTGVYAFSDDYRTATTLAVSGGELDFSLLGGELSAVTLSENTNITMAENTAIKGATITISDNVVVNMGSGATIGGDGAHITIEDNSRVQGSGGGLGEIEAEGGSLTITGSAGVRVSRVSLPFGDIVVSTTSRAFHSPYDYNTGPSIHTNVGLFVDYGGSDAPNSSDAIGTHVGDLTAENLTIKAGSYVSAYRLGSNAVMPNSGELKLETGSFIYTYIYGAFSSGHITVNREVGSTVNGKVQISISYDLNLGGSSENIEDIMPADAIYNFEPTADDEEPSLLALPIPERKGYRFDGWHFKGEGAGAGGAVTHIPSNRPTEALLIAQWTPVNIWVHLLDTDKGLDKWMAISYDDAMYGLPSYVINGNATSSYQAQGAWQGAFGSTLWGTHTERPVPGNLYDLYLRENNVDYSDGLTSDEKAILRVLENLEDEGDAIEKLSVVRVVIMKPDWTAVRYEVIFDAGYSDVVSFRYNDIVKPITGSEVGKQAVSYYIGTTYAAGAYVGNESLPGLPTPIRKGYNFTQWVSDTLTISSDDTTTVVDQSIESFQAKYEAKTLRVYLCPVEGTNFGSFATFEDPQGKLHSETINGLSVYYFEATFDSTFGVVLPGAEIIGYVHEGWEIALKNGDTIPVNSDTIIQWDDADVILPAGYTKPDGVDCVLVLTPDMRKAEITYEMHGGDWTSNVTSDMKETFKYLVNGNVLPGVTYTVVNDVYTIASADKVDPMKNSVVCSGYRFLGWATTVNYEAWEATSDPIQDYFTSEKLITASDVTYHDTTYHAIWKPCSYNTMLYAWNTDAEQDGWGGLVEVTVKDGADTGTLLTLVQNAKADQLPTMEDGSLTYTPSDSSEPRVRKLLGWMFDGEADPVKHYYNADGTTNPEYARRVAVAMNEKSLFQSGDVFQLPDSIEDPGDGGTLKLYAVYRERSLIFIYRTYDGTETVKLIADFDFDRSGEYIDVNNLITNEEKEAVPDNFVLAGWYVNSKTPVALRDWQWYGITYNHHPKHNVCTTTSIEDRVKITYDGNTFETFAVDYYLKEQGYDIYVYSYYAPQIEEDLRVYAQASASKPQDNPVFNDSFSVPDSIDVPNLDSYPIRYSVEFDNDDIQLVGKTVMDEWDGNNEWTVGDTTYHANKTFALVMRVTKDQSTWDVPLTPGSMVSSSARITKDSLIQFIVYSTNRLADTEILGTVKVTVEFPSIPEAKLTLNVELNRIAAKYELHLNANPPDYESFTDISGWGDVDASHNPVVYDFYFGSSSSTLPALTLEGYTLTGWKASDDTLVGDFLNYAPAMGENTYLAEELTAQWTVNHYLLTPDSGVQSYKSFTFKNQSGLDVEILPDGNGVYSVPYKTRVTLGTKSGCEIHQYPEFIQGADWASENMFFMPGGNVDLSFNRQVVIDEPNVTVMDESYRIGAGAPVIWRGDYVFSGDLETVTIQTTNAPETAIWHGFTVENMTSGKLLVNNNGEELTVRVSGISNAPEKIDAGNSALTLVGDGGAHMTLLPVTDAAINGKTITLRNLTVDVYLTNRKHDSGNVNTSAVKSQAFTIENDSTLNAICQSPGATYTGTVLMCESVNVLGDSVLNATAAQGCPVSASAYLIGDTTTSVSITGSKVTSIMKIDGDHTDLLLSDGSIVNMNGINAHVNVENISVQGATENNKCQLLAYDAVITGNQSIAVYADVIDHNGRHLCITSGDIAVTDIGYTQGSRTVDENRSYVLVGQGSNSVSLDSPENKIYLDGATVGTVTCDGDVNILLLSNSTISSLTGAEASVEIGTATQEKLILTVKSGIVAHRLTITGCEIDASSSTVGSSGNMVNGKVGKVTLDGSTVKANIVGALGAWNETFTLVELLNSPEVNGTLVIDHYRLEYESGDDYSVSGLPTVLRSSVSNDVETYEFAVPNVPVSETFNFWYIEDTNGDFYILSKDDIQFGNFGVINALTRDHINYALDTGDDTKTLRIRAWMKLVFSEQIAANRLLNPISTGESAVSVYTNGAWTARFTVKGTILKDSQYQLLLGEAFPAGTMLTLMDMSGAIPKYYYYECPANATTISLSAFKAMGSSESPTLLSGDDVTVVDVFQISADFSHVENVDAIENVTVKLQVVGATALGEAAVLTYTLTEKPSAKILVNGSQMTVSWDADSQRADEKMYLTVEVTPYVLPYDASVLVGGIAGTRVGDNAWLFVLGDADDSRPSTTYTWALEGFDVGDYTIEWRVSSAKENNVNALGNVWAETICNHTVAVQEPYMNVVLNTVNGIVVSSRVLDNSKTHTLVFAVNTQNANIPYYVAVEKQTALGGFDMVNDIAITSNGGTVTVGFPRGMATGVYRIFFSLDEIGINGQNELQDNVYYTFIVK